jgi:hypothetical protein
MMPEPVPPLFYPMVALEIQYADLGLRVSDHLFPGRPLFTFNQAGHPVCTLT